MTRRLAIGMYAVLWCGGIAGYAWHGRPPPGAAWAAPAFLWLGLTVVAGGSRPADRRWILGVSLAGWAVEWLGVHTGFPFGSAYRYTAELGPAPGGVPLVMAAAWGGVFAYAWQAVSVWRVPGRLRWLAGAAWVTALDLVIDPLAAGPLRFWEWHGTGWYYGIPWNNFAGWFAVALAMFAAVRRPPNPAPAPLWVGRSLVVFFSSLAVIQRLWLVAATGALLIALEVALSRRGKSAKSQIRNSKTSVIPVCS